jgi:hypothetical protein
MFFCRSDHSWNNMYMLILNFTYPLRCLRVPPVEYHCSKWRQPFLHRSGCIFKISRLQRVFTNITNWRLTDWLTVKLTVTQLDKKFSAFYGTRWITIVFTRARQWSLSWARWIQSIPSHHLHGYSKAAELVPSPLLTPTHDKLHRYAGSCSNTRYKVCCEYICQDPE